MTVDECEDKNGRSSGNCASGCVMRSTDMSKESKDKLHGRSRFLTYNAGSCNLSFDFFDISVGVKKAGEQAFSEFSRHSLDRPCSHYTEIRKKMTTPTPPKAKGKGYSSCLVSAMFEMLVNPKV